MNPDALLASNDPRAALQLAADLQNASLQEVVVSATRLSGQVVASIAALSVLPEVEVTATRLPRAQDPGFVYDYLIDPVFGWMDCASASGTAYACGWGKGLTSVAKFGAAVTGGLDYGAAKAVGKAVLSTSAGQAGVLKLGAMLSGQSAEQVGVEGPLMQVFKDMETTGHVLETMEQATEDDIQAALDRAWAQTPTEQPDK